MLIMAFAVFTLVAVMGAGMALDVFNGRGSPKMYALAHAGFALLGSALVIVAALQGNTSVITNIVLAVIIIVLGIAMSFRRAKGEQPKSLALLHGGLAVVCYLLLAYYAFAG